MTVGCHGARSMTTGRVAEKADGMSRSPRPPSSNVASWAGTWTSRCCPVHDTLAEVPEERGRPARRQAARPVGDVGVEERADARPYRLERPRPDTPRACPPDAAPRAAGAPATRRRSRRPVGAGRRTAPCPHGYARCWWRAAPRCRPRCSRPDRRAAASGNRGRTRAAGSGRRPVRAPAPPGGRSATAATAGAARRATDRAGPAGSARAPTSARPRSACARDPRRRRRTGPRRGR